MLKFTLNSTLLAMGLSVLSANSLAQLVADKTDVNSSTGKASVSATFSGPTTGDLYLATMVGGQLLFFADNGTKFSSNIAPFITNGNFSAPLHLLDVVSDGIPSGTYSLFQVVAKSGSSPLDFNNWIGGMAGLSELKFNINLAPAPLNGAVLYKDLTCGSGSCHGSNPADNLKGVLKGTTVANLRAGIKKNPVEMGFLSSNSDAELQAIADYLKTFF